MSNYFKVMASSSFVIAFISLSSFVPKHVNAATCGLQPEAPWLSATSGPGPGQVTLWWKKANNANRYAVTYGTGSNHVYGSTWIGGEKSESYTVSSLSSGTKYSFRILAAHDNCSSSPSNEVWGVAAGGVVAMAQPDQITVSSAAVSSDPVGNQMLWAKSGPGVGEATLYWKDADSANNYHLVYGTEPGKFQYGALNIGNVKWFAVRHLNPGTVYYFALVPLVGDRPLDMTRSVSAKAWMPAPVAQEVQSTPSVSQAPTVNLSEPTDEIMDAETDQVMEVEDEAGFVGGARRVGSPDDPDAYAPDGSYLEPIESNGQSFTGGAKSLSNPVEEDSASEEDTTYAPDGSYYEAL